MIQNDDQNFPCFWNFPGGNLVSCGTPHKFCKRIYLSISIRVIEQMEISRTVFISLVLPETCGYLLKRLRSINIHNEMVYSLIIRAQSKRLLSSTVQPIIPNLDLSSCSFRHIIVISISDQNSNEVCVEKQL